MTEPMTAEQLKEIMEQMAIELTAQLRVKFDEELLGYAKILEAKAELLPDAIETPGYRRAANMLRKAMWPDEVKP